MPADWIAKAQDRAKFGPHARDPKAALVEAAFAALMSDDLQTIRTAALAALLQDDFTLHGSLAMSRARQLQR